MRKAPSHLPHLARRQSTTHSALAAALVWGLALGTLLEGPCASAAHPPETLRPHAQMRLRATRPLPALRLQWRRGGKRYRIEHRQGQIRIEFPTLHHRSRLDACNAPLYRDALDGLTPRQILTRRDLVPTTGSPGTSRLLASEGSQTRYRLLLLPARLEGIRDYERRVCAKPLRTQGHRKLG